MWFLLHGETVKEETGYVDLFILYYNDDKTQIRNDHCCAGALNQWTDVSDIFPSDRTKTWKIYDNIQMRRPRQTEKVLIADYGQDWKTMYMKIVPILTINYL